MKIYRQTVSWHYIWQRQEQRQRQRQIQRQRQRQRQRQSDWKTQHVLYFWKWYDSRVMKVGESVMHHWCRCTRESRGNQGEIKGKSRGNQGGIIGESLGNHRGIIGKSWGRHQRWSARGEAPEVKHQGDAPDEMHQRWCTWCTGGDAPENFGLPRISKIP